MDALSPISLRPIGLQIAASSIMGRRTRRKLGWRLRTTYITGEIRGDTLLISRLSRFSGGGTRLCRWEDDDEVEEYSSRRRKEVGGRGRFGWKRVEDDGGGDGEWEISYPRVRNCDALPPCDICRDFHSREKRQYGQSREVYYYLSQKFIDSANDRPPLSPIAFSLRHQLCDASSDDASTCLAWRDRLKKKKWDASSIFTIAPFSHFQFDETMPSVNICMLNRNWILKNFKNHDLFVTNSYLHNHCLYLAIDRFSLTMKFEA